MSNQDQDYTPQADIGSTIHASLRQHPHKMRAGDKLMIFMFLLLVLAITFWPRN